MKRRLFLALPPTLAATLPTTAHALSFEEAPAALMDDIAASCRSADDAHARLRALLAAGAPLAEDQRAALAGCPFCRCLLPAPSDSAR